MCEPSTILGRYKLCPYNNKLVKIENLTKIVQINIEIYFANKHFQLKIYGEFIIELTLF